MAISARETGSVGTISADCVYFISGQVEAMDESAAAVCSIWHVNVDTLPEWILTSVQQVQ